MLPQNEIRGLGREGGVVRRWLGIASKIDGIAGQRAAVVCAQHGFFSSYKPTPALGANKPYYLVLVASVFHGACPYTIYVVCR